MFSCLPTFRGFHLSNTRQGSLFQSCRNWLTPQCSRIWPFSRRHPKRSTQKTGKDLDKTVISTTLPGKGQVHHATNNAQYRTECDNVSALNSARMNLVKKNKAGWLEKLVGYLVPAYQCGDFSFITNFLHSYRDLATTKEVLELLFTKYGCILPVTEGDGGPMDQLKNAISFILSTWLYAFSEDFCQPPDFLDFHVLLAYLQLNLPGSELEQFALHFLTQHEQAEAIQAEAQAPAPVSEPGLQPDLELDFPAGTPLPPDPDPDPDPVPELEAAQSLQPSLGSAPDLSHVATQEIESEGDLPSPSTSSPL